MTDNPRAGSLEAYAAALARAEADPDVVGVVVFGSQAAGSFATAESDVDCFVVLGDGARDPDRWHTNHGDPVEIWAIQLAAFREHALRSSPTAWNRPAFLRARVDLDRLDGEIGRIVERKRRLTAEEAREVAPVALDDYLNSLYRGLRNLEGGRTIEGRLDAVESVSPMLTTAFAVEERVRPFNKWLRFELASEPLVEPEFADLATLADLIVGSPTPDRLREGFRRMEAVARRRGYGKVVDGWEPDVLWLRGDSGQGASPRPSRNA
jgi:predicted nucleotidyltransferase